MQGDSKQVVIKHASRVNGGILCFQRENLKIFSMKFSVLKNTDTELFQIKHVFAAVHVMENGSSKLESSLVDSKLNDFVLLFFFVFVFLFAILEDF